ncbi:MAG TPA: DUF1232 domain-containing protein [Candidatus Limnocylindrales bacterium]|nr:DUF1232 domain-containing protein [Candidatus Limnocylindrales bacterium]
MDVPLIAGLVIALFGVWLVLVGVLWVLRPHDVRMAALLRVVPDILRLVRNLLVDRSVPPAVRVALIGLLAWLVNPIDLIPDFIPVLGPLDDVVVAILVLRFVRRRLGDEEMRRRWPGTPDGYDLLAAILR